MANYLLKKKKRRSCWQTLSTRILNMTVFWMRFGHFGAGPPRSGFWSILWKCKRHTYKTKHSLINDGAALTLHGSPAFPAPLSLPSPVAPKGAMSHWPLFSTATQLTSTLGDIMFVFLSVFHPGTLPPVPALHPHQEWQSSQWLHYQHVWLLAAGQSVPAHEKKKLQCNHTIGKSRGLTAVPQ